MASARALASRSSAAFCPRQFSVGVFFGLLFYGHDASFFGGFDNFASGGDDGFFVALARVNVFGILELLFGFGECGSGIFVSQGDVRDAQGVARFKKFERRFAVDAKDGVFDLVLEEE